MRPAFDARLALDLAELGPEAAALPRHQAPERAIALQRAELGVDDLSFLYPHPRFAAVRPEQRPQTRHRGRIEPHARPRRHARVGLEDRLDQRQRAAVGGFVPRHAEPEVADLVRARECLREEHVQRHRLLLELDGGVEDLPDGGAAGALPGRGHASCCLSKAVDEL